MTKFEVMLRNIKVVVDSSIYLVVPLDIMLDQFNCSDVKPLI